MIDRVGAVSKRKRQSFGTARPTQFLRKAIFLKIRKRMSKRRNYKTPDFLDGIAKTQWKSRIKQLSERGDIKAEDLTNLEIYCENYAIWRHSVADLAKNGFIIVNSQGTQSRNPALSAKADAEKVMIKMSSLLGFDPVSRRKNPIEVDEVDVLDEILTM